MDLTNVEIHYYFAIYSMFEAYVTQAKSGNVWNACKWQLEHFDCDKLF